MKNIIARYPLTFLTVVFLVLWVFATLAVHWL